MNPGPSHEAAKIPTLPVYGEPVVKPAAALPAGITFEGPKYHSPLYKLMRLMLKPKLKAKVRLGKTNLKSPLKKPKKLKVI